MTKRTRIRILVPLTMLLILIGIGAWMWNRPHRKVESEKGIAMSVDSLIRLYDADEMAANARFLNKAILVRGRVAEKGANADGQTTLLLSAPGQSSSVFCTMRDKGTGAAVAAEVTVKGFCSGKTMDVLLTDCVLQ